MYDDPDYAIEDEFENISGLICAHKCAIYEDCTGFNHRGRRISDQGHCQLMAALESDEREIVHEAATFDTEYYFYDKSECTYLSLRNHVKKCLKFAYTKFLRVGGGDGWARIGIFE